MKIPKQNIAVILGLLSFIGVVILFIVGLPRTQKVAFINTSKVFSEFKMKKVLESDFKKVENMRKEQLDSLLLELKLLNRNAKSLEDKSILEYKKEEFTLKRDEFGKANDALTEKYNEQIWNQLNQYIKDYGEKNGYDFIYGASGDGTLMYASEKKDVTAEIVLYVNQKYDGIGAN